MKRFLLFHGATYYPAGGWGDFGKAYDSLEEARAEADRLMKLTKVRGPDWYEIVDLELLSIVERT